MVYNKQLIQSPGRKFSPRGPISDLISPNRLGDQTRSVKLARRYVESVLIFPGLAASRA